MVIKAKKQDAPKLHSALFDEVMREEFIQGLAMSSSIKATYKESYR